jgi:acetyl-CoA/propionyl-CoA carboxylase biotin carboxyl carrier protein
VVAAGYENLGTLEFLVDGDGRFYFIEINCRIQVEHPVTEMLSGKDLVIEQIRLAAGEPLGYTQADITRRGHAIEFRINAEDPGRGFLPSPGTVERFTVPTGPGIRVDSGVRDGSTVPGQFDSLLAKLVVTGADRQQALRRARRALREFEIRGIATVLPFDRAVVDSPAFAAEGELGVYTTWIESEFASELAANPEFSPAPAEGGRRTFAVDVDGRRVTLGVPEALFAGLAAGAGAGPAANGERTTAGGGSAPSSDAALTAGMGGTIVKWLAQPGDAVEAGDGVVVLEAMKMETTVQAHRAGTVGEHTAAAGDAVAPGDVLTTIGEAAAG